MTAHFASMDPKLRRWLITICTMTATVMQALDTTIANVALPYMQGSLSASLDQINWVLTSYIVAAAIMTAPIGWLSERFGRKKLFVTCVAGFTFETIVSAAGSYFFLAHSLTTNEPFVRFEMFKDRNFLGGCIFMVVIGVVLFGTMALVTPFMQNLLGYPIQTAGFLLGARGVGTLLTMMVVPRLMRAVHPRYLILAGLLLAGGTLYYMTGFSLDVTKTTIVVTSIVQGVGLGLLFVPISTVAFATLPDHLRTGATAITTLTRNIGSSIGISMVIATLTSKTTEMHARLTEQVTPFNGALQMPNVAANLNVHTDTGRALLDMIVTQQAAMLAYINDFKLLMILTLATIPLVLIIGRARQAPGAKGEAVAID
jgi:MFS transporter, DHA2 family, multidrug resistance protein